jgi:hypothetical protein
MRERNRMDTHYGKYQNAESALSERWCLDGDRGEDSWSDSDLGEGVELFAGPFSLSWDDAKYLRAEFDCSDEELDALDHTLGMAQGLAHSWDSQGFIYAETLDTQADLAEARKRIEALNAEYADSDV